VKCEETGEGPQWDFITNSFGGVDVNKEYKDLSNMLFVNHKQDVWYNLSLTEVEN